MKKILKTVIATIAAALLPIVAYATVFVVPQGGTGSGSFSQGWIYSDGLNGGFNALNASTSPTVNYITATSTTATSTFSNGINVTGGCFAKLGSCLSLLTYPFTPTTNYAVTNQATTGIAWFQNGMNASSTSHFATTSISDSLQVGTTSPGLKFGISTMWAQNVGNKSASVLTLQAGVGTRNGTNPELSTNALLLLGSPDATNPKLLTIGTKNFSGLADNSDVFGQIDYLGRWSANPGLFPNFSPDFIDATMIVGTRCGGCYGLLMRGAGGQSGDMIQIQANDSTPVLRVTPSGNLYANRIGAGTVSPTAQLEVDGNGEVNGIYVIAGNGNAHSSDVGGDNNIIGGTGGTQDDDTMAGNGGSSYLTGGTGGSNVGATGGNGGDATITGGTGGSSAGGSQGNGGNVTIQGGPGSSVGSVNMQASGGDVHIYNNLQVDGKVTGSGGVDPAYLTLDKQTNQQIYNRINFEIPPSKQTGFTLFYNGTNLLGVTVDASSSIASVYKIPLTLVGTTTIPSAYSTTTKTEYVFDPMTGQLNVTQVAKPIRYAIRQGYAFDSDLGTFYKISTKPLDKSNVVPRSQAVYQTY